MTEIKIQQTPSVTSALSPSAGESTTAAAMPQTSKDSVRELLVRGTNATPAERQTPSNSPSPDEIIAGQSRHNPEQLMKMYLTGKLTQGQLAHELKKYNDVVADTVIKLGKEHKTGVVDYRDVGRASISNPGADLKPSQQEQEPPKARTAREAREHAKDSDNDRVKKEAERQEQKLKVQEQATRITQQVVMQRQEREQKNSQIQGEQEHQKREKENEEHTAERNRQEVGLQDELTSKTLKDRLRSNISDEIRKEVAKARSGPGTQSR